MFPSPYGVSFILIEIGQMVYLKMHNGFRLLTEYHSFLSEIEQYIYIERGCWSFRLLTEYHSFLYDENTDTYRLLSDSEFPSPYGVSFILI